MNRQNHDAARTRRNIAPTLEGMEQRQLLTTSYNVFTNSYTIIQGTLEFSTQSPNGQYKLNVSEPVNDGSLVVQVQNQFGQNLTKQWQAMSASSGTTIQNPAAAIDNSGNFILTCTNQVGSSSHLAIGTYDQTSLGQYTLENGLRYLTQSTPAYYADPDVYIGRDGSFDIAMDLIVSPNGGKSTTTLEDLHFATETSNSFTQTVVTQSNTAVMNHPQLNVYYNAPTTLDLNWYPAGQSSIWNYHVFYNRFK